MDEYPKPRLKVNPVLNFFGARVFRHLFRLRFEGASNAKGIEGGVLVVANHPTYLDPPFIIGLFNHWLKRPIATMAWEAIFSVPIVGRIVRRYGAFPVNLENPGRGPYETMLRQLKDGGPALIFPEGERSAQEVMGPWKPGALRAAHKAGAKVLPITVLHARRVWPMGLAVPRFFKPVTIIVHEAKTLEEFCVPLEGERDRDWLARCESAISEIINAPILAEAEQACEDHITNWKRKTPAHKQHAGTQWIERRYKIN
ncbi:MAG: 1-acyl-sn-glycerol-3-phosphate acyltransferase [Planctomycetes bacterium]|nr:1-acyl-sn-glycerol-3-phosphate acyltransferase [Planctomycetota bacterium]